MNRNERRVADLYEYRCTRDKLLEHLKRIEDEGDSIEHVIFEGGRDFLLVCRSGSTPGPFDGTVDRAKMLKAMEALGFDPYRVRRAILSVDRVELHIHELGPQGQKTGSWRTDKYEVK